MKIINNTNNNIEIILDDGDVLDISTLRHNKEHLIVKCINSSIHIDELAANQIKKKVLEEKEIKKMQNLLKKRKRP